MKRVTGIHTPNVFKVIKGLSHDYQDNFDEILKDAVEFIIYSREKKRV